MLSHSGRWRVMFDTLNIPGPQYHSGDSAELSSPERHSRTWTHLRAPPSPPSWKELVSCKKQGS